MKRSAAILFAALGLCSGLLLSAKSIMPESSPPEPVRLRLELDRPVLPADSRETVVVKVGLDGAKPAGVRRAPVNLALVIDKSGSMGGDKIAKAREAALEAVRRLSPDDIVSLVVYGFVCRATGLPTGAAMVSLATFFFLTEVIEPPFLSI